MTSSLQFPLFSRIIDELDGTIPGTNLYDIVRSVRWGNENKKVVCSRNWELTFFAETNISGIESLVYEIEFCPDNSRGLPEFATLTVVTVDRLFGVSGKYVEHRFWLDGGGVTHAMGVLISSHATGTMRIPIYGYPNSYRPHQDRKLDWNNFYCDKVLKRRPNRSAVRDWDGGFVIDESRAQRLLTFPKGWGNDIFRALMLLAVSVNRRGKSLRSPLPSTEDAGVLLARMVTPPNTCWGD